MLLLEHKSTKLLGILQVGGWAGGGVNCGWVDLELRLLQRKPPTKRLCMLQVRVSGGGGWGFRWHRRQLLLSSASSAPELLPPPAGWLYLPSTQRRVEESQGEKTC